MKKITVTDCTTDRLCQNHNKISLCYLCNNSIDTFHQYYYWVETIDLPSNLRYYLEGRFVRSKSISRVWFSCHSINLK